MTYYSPGQRAVVLPLQLGAGLEPRLDRGDPEEQERCPPGAARILRLLVEDVLGDDPVVDDPVVEGCQEEELELDRALGSPRECQVREEEQGEVPWSLPVRPDLGAPVEPQDPELVLLEVVVPPDDEVKLGGELEDRRPAKGRHQSEEGADRPDPENPPGEELIPVPHHAPYFERSRGSSARDVQPNLVSRLH